MYGVSGGGCLWPRCQLIASVPSTEWVTRVTDISCCRCLSYLSLWSWTWFCTVNIAVCVFGHAALCTSVMPTAVDQECKHKVLWTVQAEFSDDYHCQAISEGWSSLMFCDRVYCVVKLSHFVSTLCPRKKTKMFVVISLIKLGQLWWNLVHSLLNKYAAKSYKRFPPHLNSVSTLPCETWNAHRAHATIELLDRETPEFVQPQLWPANSPDLNPVD